MTQYKNINKEYLATLQILWNNYKELYKLSSNPGQELYRLQSVLYIFARQVVKVQELTAQFTAAKENNDLQELRRIKYVSERMSDEKAFVIVWEEAAEDYNNIVAAYKKETEAETKVKTAEEILEQSRTYLQQANERYAESLVIDL